MYMLVSKTEIWSKNWMAQRKLIKDCIPDIIEVDLEDEVDFTGHTVFNVGNHGYAGSKVLNKVKEDLAKCDRLIAFIDDYQAPPASQVYNAVRGKDNVVITNMPDLLEFKTGRMFNWAKESHYLDLNMLSWDPQPIKPRSNSGMIYYGSFRKGREEYFERYLGIDAYKYYPVTVSASKRALNKFLDMNVLIEEAPKSKDLITFLQQFQFSIYLEDKATHENYNSPANRFYECLSAGITMVFDISCKNTFDKAGIDISDYIVSCPEQVGDKLLNERKGNPAWNQRSLWAKDYKTIVYDGFKNILEKL